MKTKCKKTLITLLFSVMCLCCVFSFMFNQPAKSAQGNSDVIAMLSEGTETDVSHKTVKAASSYMQTPMPANKLTYVTNVDADGDGTVDFDTAIKISGWKMGEENSIANWIYFGLEFANPVSIDLVKSLNIRMYASFEKNVEFMVLGDCGYAMDSNVTLPQEVERPTAKHSKEINKMTWDGKGNIQNNAIITVSVLEKKLIYLADESGMVSNIAFSVGTHGGTFVDSDYLLIDAIYERDAVVTFDYDTSVTNIENKQINIKPNTKVSSPDAIYGYNVSWYSDAEKTQPFDFDSMIVKDTTIYGKVSIIEGAIPMLSEGTETDVEYKSITGTVNIMNTKLPENSMSYVTNVDVDGDSVVDFEDAVKISGWDQGGLNWSYFGLAFTNPANLEDLTSLNIKIYASFENNVEFIVKGNSGYAMNDNVTLPTDHTRPTANYSKTVNQALWNSNKSNIQRNEVTTISISNNNLVYLADEQGKVSDIAFTVGPYGGFTENDYLLIDAIYERDAVVTFDYDTSVTNIENKQINIKPNTKVSSPDAIYGYNVSWCSDEGKTQPFDFDSRIVKDTTIYGKLTPVAYSEGFITDFNVTDSRNLDISKDGSINLTLMNNKIPASGITHVTDVDTDSDGNIDAKTAMKITKFPGIHNYFTVEFANSVPVDEITAVKIRYYVGANAGLLFRAFGTSYGQSALYSQAVDDNTGWLATKKGWAELVLNNPAKLPNLNDENGNLSSIRFTVGLFDDYQEGDYLLIDEITYETAEKKTVEFKAGGEVLETFNKKVGETVAMPTADNKANKAFIGWVNGENIYKAGTEISVSDDMVYEAFYLGFVSDDKASARMIAPYGLRFTSYLDKAEKEQLESFSGASFEIKTKITSDFSDKSIDYLWSDANVYELGDDICFNAVISNIKPENFVRIYYARAYMTLTYSDGETATIQAIKETNDGRSYAQVLNAMANDDELKQDDKTFAQEQYSTISSSETLLPYVSIMINGQPVSAAQFADELTLYFNGKGFKINDNIDITDITFNGYTIDSASSVLSGVIGVRGVELTIALNANV